MISEDLQKKVLHNLKRIATVLKMLQQELDKLYEDLVNGENNVRKEDSN